MAPLSLPAADQGMAPAVEFRGHEERRPQHPPQTKALDQVYGMPSASTSPAAISTSPAHEGAAREVGQSFDIQRLRPRVPAVRRSVTQQRQDWASVNGVEKQKGGPHELIWSVAGGSLANYRNRFALGAGESYDGNAGRRRAFDAG